MSNSRINAQRMLAVLALVGAVHTVTTGVSMLFWQPETPPGTLYNLAADAAAKGMGTWFFVSGVVALAGSAILVTRRATHLGVFLLVVATFLSARTVPGYIWLRFAQLTWIVTSIVGILAARSSEVGHSLDV